MYKYAIFPKVHIDLAYGICYSILKNNALIRNFPERGLGYD